MNCSNAVRTRFSFFSLCKIQCCAKRTSAVRPLLLAVAARLQISVMDKEVCGFYFILQQFKKFRLHEDAVLFIVSQASCDMKYELGFRLTFLYAVFKSFMYIGKSVFSEAEIEFRDALSDFLIKGFSVIYMTWIQHKSMGSLISALCMMR